MKLQQIFEGVEVHGIKLFAYTVTVAELYHALPDFDEAAVPAWAALIESNERLAKTVLGKIKIDYVEENPYPNFNGGAFERMANDILVNKHLSVFKTPENTHIGFNPGQNDLFRALHDVLGHIGISSEKFYEYLLKKQKDASIGPYKPLWGGSFTVRGEMNAYLAHAKLAPKAAIPALFTEVVGQICVYFTTGDYTNNKTALIDGVDFQEVGKCYGAAAQRMDEIYRQYMDKDISEIKTKIPGISIKKSDIRWALLSKGTGAGNLT